MFHESDRTKLEQIERGILRLEKNQLLIVHRLEAVEFLLASILECLPRFPPSAPTLSGALTMSTVVLTAVLPTTRTDGSVLAASDIATIHYLKNGTELAKLPASDPASLTFTDNAPLAGDSYTAFVVDTSGNSSGASSPFVVPVPAPLAAPSPPILNGSFTP